MEKFVVLGEYDLVMAYAKTILDLFSKHTKNEYVLTIDVFNDTTLELNESDVKSVHKLLFQYICTDYYSVFDKFLHVEYEYDFTFLPTKPKITNSDIALLTKHFQINTIKNIQIKELNNEEKNQTLKTIEKNLNKFIKKHIQPITLYDTENTPINPKPQYKAKIKTDKCIIIQTPPEIHLDTNQKQAITYNGKSLLINAGPGAGKTRVIIERVAQLIKNGAKPDTILVITFTNKAAEELRERFKKDTKLEINTIGQMRISTIHSFCRSLLTDFTNTPYNLLKRESERNLFFNKHKKELGFTGPAFLRNYESGQVLKKYDEYALFEVNSEKLIKHIQSKYQPSKEYLSYIKDYYEKNPDTQYPSKKEIKAEGFTCDVYKARYLQIAKSYSEWIKLMEREYVCDQNYLLIKAVEILKDKNNLKQVQYRNILIDEFQDTDAVQMQIFEKLHSIADTFTIVGDADQSIYSFRAANPKFFNNYYKSSEFENKTLTNNYRSTAEIVDFNEKYIRDKRVNPKKLKTTNPGKMPVYLLENNNDSEEYRGITYIIKNLMDSGKISKYSDVCVLFRSHKDKKDILDEFEKQEIPYYLKGINDLIYQDEVKAILVLLWYLLPFKPTRIAYYGDGGQWINLSSFTDKYYEASKIFKLTPKTQKILNRIEQEYQSNVLNIKNNYTPLTKDTNSNSIMSVIRDYSDETINQMFDNIHFTDISNLNTSELKNLGITDEHDLDFFAALNDLKSSIREVKLTSLQIFYELLKITGYVEDLLTQADFDSKKALLNLSLISEIISDYENIMGKYDLNGLFNYIYRSLKYYSCPINEEEDNTDKVHIMTVHKAKGLEYPVVITSSVKNNSFPLKYSKQRHGHVFRNTPLYPTPNHFLKYKVSEKEEEIEFNHEEERVLYVANTRAEELLILSTVSPTNNLPRVLKEYENDLVGIEPSDVFNMKKITSHITGENTLFNQIDFENILSDYLFCPLKYNLESNLKFKNPENINKFINSKIQVIVNRLHNDKFMTDWDDESILDLISKVIKSYSFASGGEKLRKLFSNFTDYWREYGMNFEVIDTSYHVSLEVHDYMINGVVDLIIRDGEGVSLVHFIQSRDKIRNYHHFYMDLLGYYAMALTQVEDVKVENLILYVLDEAKIYEQEYREDAFLIKYLEGVIQNIDGDDYTKHRVNCKDCEFNDYLCTGH